MQIQVQEVTNTYVAKGKGGYNLLEVVYTSNGKNSTKKLFSFNNPKVFDTLKDATSGSNWDVEVKKNGEFWDWVDVKRLSEEPAKVPIKSGAYTPGVDPRETADERALRQLYIIRQSSLANAIEYLNHNKRDETEIVPMQEVIDVAQRFVDFVYGNGDSDIFDEPNDI